MTKLKCPNNENVVARFIGTKQSRGHAGREIATPRLVGARNDSIPFVIARHNLPCHCEERSDEAILVGQGSKRIK